jgi:hypothetical protein
LSQTIDYLSSDSVISEVPERPAWKVAYKIDLPNPLHHTLAKQTFYHLTQRRIVWEI